jgi:hypothetical protein
MSRRLIITFRTKRGDAVHAHVDVATGVELREGVRIERALPVGANVWV